MYELTGKKHGADSVVTQTELEEGYRNVRRACQQDWRAQAAGAAIGDLAEMALRFLAEAAEPVGLQSSVEGKRYFSFSRNGVVARPANSALFECNAEAIGERWRCWQDEPPQGFERLAYTVALAPCLALELLNRNNKKGPATYFECVVGHIFARALNLEPTRSTTLSILGTEAKMTMDFLFETGEGADNIHLPIKMSTRERIVQAWAHQRILNMAFRSENYRGVMVLFSETKLNSQTLDVVEICVPNQWLIYQTLLAKMDCIYYFDMPVRYRELTATHPDAIEIKPMRDVIAGIEAFAAR